MTKRLLLYAIRATVETGTRHSSRAIATCRLLLNTTQTDNEHAHERWQKL